MGTLARALENFFTDHGLALPTDQAGRLAAGRRQRRVDAVPAALRPAVKAFCAWMPLSRIAECVGMVRQCSMSVEGFAEMLQRRPVGVGAAGSCRGWLVGAGG